MIEIPEAVNLSQQIIKELGGKKILKVVAGSSPHKFAWYHGNPKDYGNLLNGKTINSTTALGGMVEIKINDAILLISDGVALRFHSQNEKRPRKHQLLIEFCDGTAMSASIQIYGGLWCFKEGEFQNPYHDAAKTKPSPLSEDFDWVYFSLLINSTEVQKLSAKAFLATEQRIPGLGNGVLQDILFNAKVHPKRKIKTLTEDEKKTLFNSIKSTLKEMAIEGGRETVKDLFGKPGGYKMKLGQNTIDKPCSGCGSTIRKQPYMGGSIYFCGKCQSL